MLGSVGDIEGLFIATAHYRNGILLAPLTAKLLAEKIVNSVDSEYFTMFGAARFRLSSVSTGS
jgi:glycine oxidase